MWSMFLLIILTLCAGFIGWLFFIWAVKSGQYDDIEGPKYRMLDDEEDKKKDNHDPKMNKS
jgi:cbb3-type cytochrome oxidase maturation protein